MKIDWSSYSAEDVLSTVDAAPRVASVWKYSQTTSVYQRHMLWHPKKGSQSTWITVGTVWSNDGWWGCCGGYDLDEDDPRFGPFADRFAAASAVDVRLERDGWKLCK